MFLGKAVFVACSLTAMVAAIPALAQDVPNPIGFVTAPMAVTITPVVPLKAPPEPTGLADIIRAKFPLAVQYKEFGAGWRELTWNGSNYFTKGETHWLNGAEFVVAYKYAPRLTTQLSEKDYSAAVTGNVYAFSPDDRFEITLLHMTQLVPYVTSGNTYLRSFDPTRRRTPFDAGKASQSFNENLSLIYLQKIHAVVAAYSASYLQVMPPLETAFAARQALLPFAESGAIFTRPGTDQPYKANPLLSNRKRAHLRKKGQVVLFYEAQPAADGLRAVLQLNGTVRRVDEKSWNNLKKISELE